MARGGAVGTAGDVDDRQDRRSRSAVERLPQRCLEDPALSFHQTPFFGKQTCIQYSSLRLRFAARVFWEDLWFTWIPYNRYTSISAPLTPATSILQSLRCSPLLGFLFKPRVCAKYRGSGCPPSNALTHTLMIILKSVDYNTSEGSDTRHNLDRFTSLGTMLSCTVYG